MSIIKTTPPLSASQTHTGVFNFIVPTYFFTCDPYRYYYLKHQVPLCQRNIIYLLNNNILPEKDNHRLLYRKVTDWSDSHFNCLLPKISLQYVLFHKLIVIQEAHIQKNLISYRHLQDISKLKRIQIKIYISSRAYIEVSCYFIKYSSLSFIFVFF